MFAIFRNVHSAAVLFKAETVSEKHLAGDIRDIRGWELCLFRINACTVPYPAACLESCPVLATRFANHARNLSKEEYQQIATMLNRRFRTE